MIRPILSGIGCVYCISIWNQKIICTSYNSQIPKERQQRAPLNPESLRVGGLLQRRGFPFGHGSKARTPNPTTKIGYLKWVVNSPIPSKMGSQNGFDKQPVGRARWRSSAGFVGARFQTLPVPFPVLGTDLVPWLCFSFSSGSTSASVSATTSAGRGKPYCGWTKSISHQGEAMGNHCLLVFAGAIIIPGINRW